MSSRRLPAVRPLVTFVLLLVALVALVVSAPSSVRAAAQAEPSVPAATRPAPGTALVTGANRGLGLEFARQLAAAGWTVIGTARKPDDATALRALGVRVEQLDVADAASVAAFERRLDGAPLDLLINNAGVPVEGGRTSITFLDFEAAERALRVNTLGPMRVTKAMLPNLRAGSGKQIVNISSRLGSIELDTSGGFYGYRESKAALNIFTRSLAAELKPEGFTCVAMSPGWVRTRMGGDQAPLSPKQSIGGMLTVIAGLTSADTGTYVNHEGARLPW